MIYSENVQNLIDKLWREHSATYEIEKNSVSYRFRIYVDWDCDEDNMITLWRYYLGNLIVGKQRKLAQHWFPMTKSKFFESHFYDKDLEELLEFFELLIREENWIFQ